MAQDKNTARYANTVEIENQCDAGEITYHIVQIVPSNRDFLNPTTNLGRELSELKSDVSDIQTNVNWYFCVEGHFAFYMVSKLVRFLGKVLDEKIFVLHVLFLHVT